MTTWDHRDIRQSLPDYVERGGDVVYKAPYRATSADLNALVLSADRSALQRLVDKELNACVRGKALVGSEQGLHFQCVDDWIVFIYSLCRSLGSVDEVDKRTGAVSSLELSVWIPVVKRQLVSGTISSQTAWFLPLLYTSPTGAVITGREVYGYPKVPAFLKIPDEGGPPVAVELRGPFPSQQASNARQTSPVPSRASRAYFSDPNLKISNEGFGSELPTHPLIPTVVDRYFANVPLIFRKQVCFTQERAERGGASVKAGYTALVEARVPITRVGAIDSIEPRAHPIELDAAVAADLGLTDRTPLFGIAVRDCTLDIQHGREIWVAQERAAHIPRLAAPGNDLLEGSGTFDIAPRPSSRQKQPALDPASNVIHGVGEAYLVRTRPEAIGALLARHFPPHLGARPSPDPRRDFVLFGFVRAELEGSVLLYEFSVWVPVRLGKEAAWYAPYMFRSPGSAVIHAREWFGHPCQEAFIEFQAKSDKRRVLTTLPLSDAQGRVSWVKTTGVSVEPVRRGDRLPARIEIGDPDLTSIVNLENVVGLLQARHAADTSKACFQQVVTSRRSATAEIEPIGARKITLAPNLYFGHLLDLQNHTQVVTGYSLRNLKIISTPSTPVPHA